MHQHSRTFVSWSSLAKRSLLLYDFMSFFFFARVFSSSSGWIASHCARQTGQARVSTVKRKFEI